MTTLATRHPGDPSAAMRTASAMVSTTIPAVAVVCTVGAVCVDCGSASRSVAARVGLVITMTSSSNVKASKFDDYSACDIHRTPSVTEELGPKVTPRTARDRVIGQNSATGGAARDLWPCELSAERRRIGPTENAHVAQADIPSKGGKG